MTAQTSPSRTSPSQTRQPRQPGAALPAGLDDCFVVGFDDSRASRRALKAAADAATLQGRPLVVLVITAPDQLWNDGLDDLYQTRRPAKAQAATTAARAVARLGSSHPGLPVHVVQARDAQDERVRSLGQQARLLVLGVRGARGQRALTMGATSAEIARVFCSPVLIVDDGYRSERWLGGDGPGRVVVGIDGREDTDRVLAVAADEAHTRGCELVAVHSTPAGVAGSTSHDHLTARCWDALARMPHSGSTGGPRLTHRLVLTQADPVSALVATATPADLLVVGTRGGGRLAGLVAGSVSRAVFTNAPCDVLVVRTSSAARAASAARS